MVVEKDKKLEIVIVAYNTPLELLMCLTSVRLFTRNSKVIIVDNGNDDQMWEMVKGDKIIKTVIKEGNLGFCRGVNKGVEKVETEQFAILPADCIITEGWENRMLYQIPTLKKPGIVAPMCTQTSGYQGVERNGLMQVTQVIKRVVLNGAVMFTEDFLKVGGMDTDFPNMGGNFSDDDLSRRFYDAGYINYIVNHLIYHNQARSYGGKTEGMANDFRQGLEYYKKKWKESMDY